jgi:NitT/TauT family transport system substrate-binding protein
MMTRSTSDPTCRDWRGVAAALLVLLCLAACAPAPAARPEPAASAPPPPAPPAAAAPAAPPTPLPERAIVRVGYAPVYSLAPTFIAKEMGYFDAENLDVQLEQIASGPEGFAATAAGHLEVTTTSAAAAVLNAWATGVDIRMFAAEQAYLAEGPAGTALVVRKELKDSGQVTRVADLRGRKVAINALGTATEWSADAGLRTDGLTAADVDLTPMNFPDVLPALANGAVDAALAIEPTATGAVVNGVGEFLTTDIALGAQITVLIGNGTWLRQKPDVATRYLVAYLRAARDLYGDGWHRDDNVAIIEQWTRLPAATIQRVLPIYCDPNGVINVDSLEAQQAFYMERGYLRYSAPLALRGFLDDGPRAAAVARLGEFTKR